ncbi:54S ribosomal protein L16, mitochondrial [Neolecta irregularis DAH-3]|uniref:54S ribosomal protein L16, mitochondrial n=1 Tax=Neolecta irregularis (strain DAH-3) TaxID=1198029 RepID=A0A1U7LNW0_NEOID|nr:54S ribosomal protein L16, mitochondrial [Neolecta irregularis DAH-3]|eukprot:OLL24211.1 54S ribosomal protein L16, mitochondrial [Neolecta irregularis DAH-3]
MVLRLQIILTLAPKTVVHRRAQKGRIPVPSGGSTKGMTLEHGDFGLRLIDEGRRISAKQFQVAEATIKRVIKVNREAKCYLRVATHLAVCTKGNESRMGKGKGGFDHWAARVSHGKITFEIGGGDIREEIARDALRQAGAKLPGRHQFVKRQVPKL